jgi:CubicO group peptidase (beta-lactamase class C family)
MSRWPLMTSVVLVVLMGQAAAQTSVFPGTTWQEASPESQGVDSHLLQAAFAYLDNYVSIDETVVIRHGYMIWRGNDIGYRRNVASCTKSITSTLLGLLISDGKVALSTKVVTVVPTIDDRYSGYNGITFRHFATMTSGYDMVKGPTTGYDCDSQGRCDQNQYRLAPSAPLFTPGTRYRYWDDAMLENSYALTVVANKSLRQLFAERIAAPIGMQNWSWNTIKKPDGTVVHTPAGHAAYNGTGGLKIDAKNLARFGYLFLRRGRWKDRQLVSASWVDSATVVQVPKTMPYDTGMEPRQLGPGVYGYNWWVNGVKPDGKRKWPNAPARTFMASGSGQNWLFVIPEWDMVIVRLGASSLSNADQVRNTFLDKVGDAILAS